MSEPANRTHRLLSAAATTNDTLVSAGAGISLRGVEGYNAKATGVYLKLYDKTTAPASTDTPEKTIYLPATTAFAIPFDYAFDLGLGYRLTTGSADNDTGVLVAGDVLALNVEYRL